VWTLRECDKRNRSSDRLRLTMEYIVKCVLDPSVQLPEFHVKNLARLPPVDVSHCDVSAILLELRALRAEVRSKKGSDCSKS